MTVLVIAVVGSGRVAAENGEGDDVLRDDHAHHLPSHIRVGGLTDRDYGCGS